MKLRAEGWATDPTFDIAIWLTTIWPMSLGVGSALYVNEPLNWVVPFIG